MPTEINIFTLIYYIIQIIKLILAWWVYFLNRELNRQLFKNETLYMSIISTPEGISINLYNLIKKKTTFIII